MQLCQTSSVGHPPRPRDHAVRMRVPPPAIHNLSIHSQPRPCISRCKSWKDISDITHVSITRCYRCGFPDNAPPLLQQKQLVPRRQFTSGKGFKHSLSSFNKLNGSSNPRKLRALKYGLGSSSVSSEGKSIRAAISGPDGIRPPRDSPENPSALPVRRRVGESKG